VTVRLMLVDDIPPIRRGLRSIIEKETNWQVCGEAGNGKVAIELAQEPHPDVILLDLFMSVMNGFEAAKQIKIIAPQTYILLFTLHDSPTTHRGRPQGWHQLCVVKIRQFGKCRRRRHSFFACCLSRSHLNPCPTTKLPLDAEPPICAEHQP